MTPRQAIEAMYIGRCDVIERVSQINPVTKRTEFIENKVYENQKCRLSFSRSPVTNISDNVAQLAQTTKLFIVPELNIPAGSKIIITQNSTTTEYQNSGEIAKYQSHQEISLNVFKRWA